MAQSTDYTEYYRSLRRIFNECIHAAKNRLSEMYPAPIIDSLDSLKDKSNPILEGSKNIPEKLSKLRKASDLATSKRFSDPKAILLPGQIQCFKTEGKPWAHMHHRSINDNTLLNESSQTYIFGLNQCTFIHLAVSVLVCTVLIVALAHYFDSRKPERMRKSHWYELNLRKNKNAWLPVSMLVFWIVFICFEGYTNLSLIVDALASAFFSLPAFAIIPLFITLLSGFLFALSLSQNMSSVILLNIPNLFLCIASAGNIIFNWYEVSIMIRFLIFCYITFCTAYSLKTAFKKTGNPTSSFFSNINVILPFVFGLTLFQGCQFYSSIAIYKYFAVPSSGFDTQPFSLGLFFVLTLLFLINQKILSVLSAYYYDSPRIASVCKFKTMLNHVFYNFGKIILTSFFEAVIAALIFYLNLVGVDQNDSSFNIIPLLSFILMVFYFISTNITKANIIYVTRKFNTPTRDKDEWKRTNTWNLKFMSRLAPTLGFILIIGILFSSFPIDSNICCLQNILSDFISGSGVQSLFRLLFTGSFSLNFMSILSSWIDAKDYTAFLILSSTILSFCLHLFTTLKGFVVASFFFTK